MAKELYEQIIQNKASNVGLARTITERVYQNRNVNNITRKDIRNQLVNYSEKAEFLIRDPRRLWVDEVSYCNCQ